MRGQIASLVRDIASFGDLRHVAHILADHPDELVRRHGARLAQWLDEHRPERLRQRDEAIARLWRTQFGASSASAAAREIATALRRYAGGAAWRRDRGLALPPGEYGERARLLFEIMHASEGEPVGERRCRQILAMSSPFQLPKDQQSVHRER